MQQALTTFTIDTRGPGLVEITDRVGRWLADQSIGDGLLTVFCRHTSASLLVNENAAGAVRRDLEAYFARIAPADPDAYEHDDEGPDDMPAHLRTALTGVSLAIPVLGGRLALGTWQGVFLFEHRARPHRRQIVAHLIGEAG